MFLCFRIFMSLWLFMWPTVFGTYDFHFNGCILCRIRHLLHFGSWVGSHRSRPQCDCHPSVGWSFLRRFQFTDFFPLIEWTNERKQDSKRWVTWKTSSTVQFERSLLAHAKRYRARITFFRFSFRFLLYRPSFGKLFLGGELANVVCYWVCGGV